MKRRPMPCATKLRLLLAYDPETGDLTWRLSARRGYKPGDIAGSVHKGRNTYRVVVIEGLGYYAHSLIWKIVTGEEPDGLIDHEDTDGLNNKWANLRPATNVQNGQNRRLNKNNKSGVKGVHRKGDYWRAVITVNKTPIRLGTYELLEDAAAVVSAARQHYHADFARAA
jgi:hypothetical protein